MNKIKEKFSEICFFIENPKDYELLYYKEDDIHNEYALDLEEAKKIINTIESLQKEKQELKKQLEELRNGYKKKLEKLLSDGIEPDLEDFYLAEIEGKANDYDELLEQQKEFIKYLEDEIQKQETVIAENQEKSYFSIYEDKKENLKLSSQKAYTRRRILEEILKKYKEIIGDDKK